ncbi:hypothetical protein JH282_13135 [Xanthomonas campestris pv. campestris]|nr:hypothetical protein JH282_13135 [Xanthomonas campestris pv. campestris]
MDSDVLVCALEPVPGQDFVSSTADELHVLTSRSLLLDSSCHVGKGLPEVAAIRTGSPQGGHRGIQTLKVTAKLGSVHGLEYQQPCRIA